MDKRFWLVIGVILLAGAAVWRVQHAFSRMQTNRPDTRAVKILDLRGHKIETEVVSSQADIRQGLSNRESLDRNKGMLFELGYRGIHPFWMNRMRFPLDIIWIDDKTVVEIAENVPSPKFGEIPYTHVPKAEADRVLELNAGMVQETGLGVGDGIGGL